MSVDGTEEHGALVRSVGARCEQRDREHEIPGNHTKPEPRSDVKSFGKEVFGLSECACLDGGDSEFFERVSDVEFVAVGPY